MNNTRVVVIFVITALVLQSLSFFPSSMVGALRYSPNTDLSNVDGSFRGETTNTNDQFGRQIEMIGDVNGDGLDDFISSAPFNDDNTGADGQIYLFYGKRSGWSMDKSATDANASFTGTRTFEMAGWSLSRAGDMNNDGFDDFIISGDMNGNGSAYLFFGKSQGWSWETNLSKADVVFEGEMMNDVAGSDISGGGDINGDGFDDIIISAFNNQEGGFWGFGGGQTYLIFGKETGWNSTIKLDEADASFIGQEGGDQSGLAVSIVGDVNGDRYDDFLIGAPGNNSTSSQAGQIYLFFGGPSGWGIDTNLSQANASFVGTALSGRAGTMLAGAGDVNGDGFDDFLISGEGRSNLIFGRKSPWSMGTTFSSPNASFPNSMPTEGSCQGDIDGDGFDDIVLSNPYTNDNGINSGKLYVILGKSSGWTNDFDVELADLSFLGEAGSDLAGGSFSMGGDLNGDGFDDIVLGAYGNDEAGVTAGQSYVIFPDENKKPSSITSIKLYTDDTYSQEATVVEFFKEVFIELQGTDGNTSRMDHAIVNVTSNVTSPMGFRLHLVETGINTGNYRGSFTLANRTHRNYRYIDAISGETVMVTSTQDGTKNDSIIAKGPLTLLPLEDSPTAQEDSGYEAHYYTNTLSTLTWKLDTNASWLSWNGTNQNITGTPDNGDVGWFWVNINVTDNFNYGDEHNFTLTVENTVPIIQTMNDIETVEDEEYMIDYNSSDDGQGTITWHLATQALWLGIDEVTGVVNGTPDNDDVGSYGVNVSVDDGNGGWNYTNFSLTVMNSNDPPDIVTSDVIWATEDALYSVDYEATDIDGDTVFEWFLDTNASWLNIDRPTGVLSGTPGNDHVGGSYVNISVQDQGGGVGDHNFTITVNNTNDPPQWENVPIDPWMNDTETYTFDVNATDMDVGDVLSYDLTSASPTTATIDPDTGVITWEPDAHGTYSFTITATDGIETINHDFAAFVIHVDTNRAPTSILVFPVQDEVVDVLNPTYIWTVSDEDGDNVTSDIYLGVDKQAVTDLDSTALLEMKLVNTIFNPIVPLEKATTYYWTVIPFDGEKFGDCDSGVWSFTVSDTAEVNNPPKFTNEPQLEAGIGKEWTYGPQVTDADTGDEVTISLVQKPDGMTFSSGIVRWTPTSNQIGDHTVKIEASDGKATVIKEFMITVTKDGPINHIPVIQPVEPAQISEKNTLELQIVASDVDGDPLTYALFNGPEGMEIGDTGLITWKTKKGDHGKYKIQVNVSDGKLTATTTFSVIVKQEGKQTTDDMIVDPMMIGVIVAIVVVAMVLTLLFIKKKGGKEPVQVEAPPQDPQPAQQVEQTPPSPPSPLPPQPPIEPP